MTFDELNLSKQADGLLPVIVQDAVTLKVLMLGYMNREAFDRSMAEGRVTFFSRTRSCLWTKGETSGNYLAIESVYADCDRDTLLIKASPAGPVCHRGTTSCFDTPDAEGFIRREEDRAEGGRGGCGERRGGRRRQSRPFRLRSLGFDLSSSGVDGADGVLDRGYGARTRFEA